MTEIKAPTYKIMLKTVCKCTQVIGMDFSEPPIYKFETYNVAIINKNAFIQFDSLENDFIADSSTGNREFKFRGETFQTGTTIFFVYEEVANETN